MRPLATLLLVAACSRELAHPPYLERSLFTRSTTPNFTVALFTDRPSARPPDRQTAPPPVRPTAHEATSHTTNWTDSSRLGDVTFYSRGRVVTTVTLLTDSVWATTNRPPAALGLPSGPFNLPPDSLCTMEYTATTLAVVPTRVLHHLQRISDCKAKTFAQILLSRLKDSTGNLSVQRAQTELNTWPWPGLCARVQDSTILAFYIGDDVENAEWGSARLPTRLARWDTIAGFIQSKCPGAPVAIRAHPTQLEARGAWQWLTTAWTQYSGPHRRGPPEQFLATQVASARRQRLGLVAGVNLLNGGCGPAELRRCLPDVPGTSVKGNQAASHQLSAAELVYYKTVALSDPYVCASIDWSWGPNYNSDFHSRAEIRSAAKTLGLIARGRPRGNCVQR
jgi:hypothetical protein